MQRWCKRACKESRTTRTSNRSILHNSRCPKWAMRWFLHLRRQRPPLSLQLGTYDFRLRWFKSKQTQTQNNISNTDFIFLFQDNCREVVLPSDKPFRRLDHYKMHEYSRKLSLTKDPLTMTHLATSIDGMFRRKRGRPPKNRVIEVWNDYVSIWIF